MNPPHRSAQRVTGNLRQIDRREGPVWYTRTRVPGRTPVESLRRLAPAHLTGGKPPAGHLTPRQAQDALDDLLAEERRKVGHGAYDHVPATFAEAAAGYLHHVEHVRGRAGSTLRDYRGSIDTYLIPRWGDWAVSAVTPDDVERFRDELIAAGELSPRTIVRHLTVAHGVFKHAMRRHGLARNPASAELVDRPSVEYSGEFTTLDPEQLAALVRAAATEQDAVLYLTAAQTGLRQGELRALRWRDVDFAADRIHARRSATTGGHARIKTTKTGRVRSVPMVPQVATALAQLGQREHFTGDDELVFPDAVGEVENDALIRRRYRRAVKAAGLPRVRFHDLRHAFGSTAVKAFPLSDVQAMLGHSHIATTMRYVHHRPGADDAQRLAAAFEATPYPEPYPETGGTGTNERN